MNSNDFHKLISGQTKGVSAGLLKLFFIAISKIYSVIIRFRNLLYDKHIFTIHHTKAAVISIGNITVGGTGKTPLVIWFCNLIHQENISCAVLTRGYKTVSYNQIIFF